MIKGRVFQTVGAATAKLRHMCGLGGQAANKSLMNAWSARWNIMFLLCFPFPSSRP